MGLCSLPLFVFRFFTLLYTESICYLLPLFFFLLDLLCASISRLHALYLVDGSVGYGMMTLLSVSLSGVVWLV